MVSNLLKIAIEAAFEAGKVIMNIYENDDFEVDFKSDDSPLTKADIASHNIIIQHLEKTGIPVLSEEGRNIPFVDRSSWKQLWSVDPIDGTKEFIKRNGEFTVNIALIENNIPVLGVVYAPAIDKLYFAEAGKAYLKVVSITDSTESILSSLTTSTLLPHGNLEKFTVVASKSHMSPETEDYINALKVEHGEVELISKGSSLKLCLVAEGLANCYPRFAPTMEWDTAAGDAICRNAGKEVIDWKTQELMKYNREELLNNWFLVK